MEKLNDIAKEFRSSLKTIHKDEFEGISIGDMQREIHEKQAMRDKTNNMINMNRLRMFIRGMESLEKVLCQLEFPDTSSVMSIIWGSVRFLFKTTDAVDRALDGVLEVYERLGAELIDLTEHEQLFSQFPDTIKCLVNIFGDIQRFHLLAYNLFSLNPQLWQRLQKPVWEDSSRRFKKLTESLNNTAKFIKNQSSYSQRAEYSDTHAAFQRYFHGAKSDWADFEKEESDRKHEQKNSVITWISASGKMERLQKKFRSMAICPNSGRWLFRNHSTIAKWMSEENTPDSAIWLHGNFGYGKTVLASLIVDELKPAEGEETRFSLPEDSKTCFFYCEKDDNEHRSHLDILKGILLQMVESEDYILPLCNQERMTSGGVNLMDARVAQKLIKTYIEYCPRQYIVIDGLDECESTEIHQTAKFFKELVSKYDTSIRLGHLRVMFIGRETSDTRRHIPGDNCVSIALKPEDNQDDIQAFVVKRLPDFFKSDNVRGFSLSEADKTDIERKICRQSEDSFLYAHLAIEYLLQQDTKGEILGLLRGGVLPAKLGDLYESLLDSVKKRLEALENGQAKWQRTMLLFGWLVCAKRPLRWHEMQAILSFDQVEFKFDLEDKMLRQDMENYLGSIVHVLDGGYIRLVHSTARMHIIQNKHIKEMHVQCQLATTCLRYLSLPSFAKGYESTERSKHAKLGWFSFQDYACSQWLWHVDTVLRECSDLFTSNSHCEAAQDFVSALVRFVNTHRGDLSDTEHAELDTSNLESFRGIQSYYDIRLLWNHIFTHQNGDYGARNKIGIAQIETALQDNRTELERYTPSDVVGDEDTIEVYYGLNLYKCYRTLCRFFYVGYEEKSARESHEKRHDRPFQCPVSCSSAPLGFMSNKDRDRHINIYHPTLSEAGTHFEVLSRRQAPGNFMCTICQKSFTRNINLRSHERSHFGDRPRHEKIHARRGY
ncbi:Ff.00g068020.m01.CDS01 [Fusarium sp. VM40]|nr:Ff.00g068020.m01.CDS01 [Fusarium sp. VM40]